MMDVKALILIIASTFLKFKFISVNFLGMVCFESTKGIPMVLQSNKAVIMSQNQIVGLTKYLRKYSFIG